MNSLTFPVLICHRQSKTVDCGRAVPNGGRVVVHVPVVVYDGPVHDPRAVYTKPSDFERGHSRLYRKEKLLKDRPLRFAKDVSNPC